MSGYVKIIMNGDDGFIVIAQQIQIQRESKRDKVEHDNGATDRLCTVRSNLNENIHHKRLRSIVLGFLVLLKWHKNRIAWILQQKSIVSIEKLVTKRIACYSLFFLCSKKTIQPNEGKQQPKKKRKLL